MASYDENKSHEETSYCEIDDCANYSARESIYCIEHTVEQQELNETKTVKSPVPYKIIKDDETDEAYKTNEQYEYDFEDKYDFEDEYDPWDDLWNDFVDYYSRYY
jgi:hypothetical protein